MHLPNFCFSDGQQETGSSNASNALQSHMTNYTVLKDVSFLSWSCRVLSLMRANITHDKHQPMSILLSNCKPSSHLCKLPCKAHTTYIIICISAKASEHVPNILTKCLGQGLYSATVEISMECVCIYSIMI